MILIISPAKKLDFDDVVPEIGMSRPQLMSDAVELASIMSKQSQDEIKHLMKLSDNLASLNFERYQSWTDDISELHSKQAILAFRGDVYAGMAATSFEQSDFDFAQRHLRILSGLYGVLRPLDMIQPHRLEMGTKLANKRGRDLYAFWREKSAKLIDYESPIINLSSQEYFKSIEQSQLSSKVITPVFKDMKNGEYKIISIYAKKARGMMVDFALRNRLSNPEQLKEFSAAGYKFSKDGSNDEQLLFLRDMHI